MCTDSATNHAPVPDTGLTAPPYAGAPAPAASPPSGASVPPPMGAVPGAPQTSPQAGAPASGSCKKKQNDSIIDQPTRLWKLSPDVEGATDNDKAGLDPENAYVDDGNNVWEKDATNGKYKRVGYVGTDGKFHRYSEDKIMQDNYGARSMEPKDRPKGYQISKDKEPMIDANSDVWEKGRDGKYKKVGHVNDRNVFEKFSPKRALQENTGATDMTTANQPAGYEYDKDKYPMVDDKGSVYEWNKDEGKYEKVGSTDGEGKFKKNGDTKILEDNYGPLTNLNADGATIPRNYTLDRNKHAKIDADGNLWEWNKAKGKYQNVGTVDKDNMFHANAKVGQPDPENLEAVAQADLASGSDTLPKGAVKDTETGDVYAKDETGKYIRWGHVDDDGKFTRYSNSDIIRDNYGAEGMDPGNPPDGYEYKAGKDPQVDDNNNVWEYNDATNRYHNVGYIGDDNRFHANASVTQPKKENLETMNQDSLGEGSDQLAGGEVKDKTTGDVFVKNGDHYMQVGHVDDKGVYHRYSNDDILRDNYGAENMDPDNVPQGYDYDKDKHPKIDDAGNIWEYDDGKGYYEKAGYKGTDNKYHVDASATQPKDPVKADRSRYGNGEQMPNEAYIDDNRDVYGVVDDKYVLTGHVDDNGKYHKYGIDDFMKKNYGAEAMDQDNPPQGYTYEKGKYPKIDDNGNVWEWNQATQNYHKKGYVDDQNAYHKY